MRKFRVREVRRVESEDSVGEGLGVLVREGDRGAMALFWTFSAQVR